MQLPDGGDAPPRRAPVAVAAIALADILLFVILLGFSQSDVTAFVDRWGLVPRELLRALATRGPGSETAWLTPLSSMFVHVDPLHLAGNLLYLWIFGAELEERLGHARFLVFYAVCGLAAAALHVAIAPDSFVPALGASGAISGLLGAYAANGAAWRLRLYWPRVEVLALVLLLLWLALQLASGIDAWGGAGVAIWAHAGGFAAGALLARGARCGRPARARLRS